MIGKKIFFAFFFSFFVFSQAKFMEEKSHLEMMMLTLNNTDLKKTNQLKIKFYDHITKNLNKPPFKDANGWTLFNYLIISDNQELIRYFLDTANILGQGELLKYLQSEDVHGNTPLHLVAKFGKINSVKILLAYGANSVAINKDGKTPENSASCSYCSSDFEEKCESHQIISELLSKDLYTNWAQDQKSKQYSQAFTPKKGKQRGKYFLLTEEDI